MSKHEGEGREPEPAAQTNLGPAPHSGGEADFGDRRVPPYDDRQTEALRVEALRLGEVGGEQDGQDRVVAQHRAPLGGDGRGSHPGLT